MHCVCVYVCVCVFVCVCVCMHVCVCQFPSVTHPQTLERRYQGILTGLMLDLMKVKCRGILKHCHKHDVLSIKDVMSAEF